MISHDGVIDLEHQRRQSRLFVAIDSDLSDAIKQVIRRITSQNGVGDDGDGGMLKISRWRHLHDFFSDLDSERASKLSLGQHIVKIAVGRNHFQFFSK